MKKGIHPKMNHVVFVDGPHQIITKSVKSSDRTMDIDGVPHFVIPVDVSSFTHPLYTGEKRFVDSKGQVGRFQDKMKKADEFKKQLAKKTVKIEEKKQERSRTLKDLLLEV